MARQGMYPYAAHSGETNYSHCVTCDYRPTTTVQSWWGQPFWVTWCNSFPGWQFINIPVTDSGTASQTEVKTTRFLKFGKRRQVCVMTFSFQNLNHDSCSRMWGSKNGSFYGNRFLLIAKNSFSSNKEEHMKCVKKFCNSMTA